MANQLNNKCSKYPWVIGQVASPYSIFSVIPRYSIITKIAPGVPCTHNQRFQFVLPVRILMNFDLSNIYYAFVFSEFYLPGHPAKFVKCGKTDIESEGAIDLALEGKVKRRSDIRLMGSDSDPSIHVLFYRPCHPLEGTLTLEDRRCPICEHAQRT